MDPAKLTKDRLRSELIAHSVALPSPKAKKEEYVHLYKEHILPLQLGDFSSDEESSPVKLNFKAQHSYTSEPAAETMDLDISSLSDKELSQMLRDLGQNPGPIMRTTRKVHEKKLERLLTEKPHTNGSAAVEFSDEEEEEVEEVEEEEEEEEELEPEPVPVLPVRANRRVIESREEKRDVRQRLTRDIVDAPTASHRDSARFRSRPEIPSVPTQSTYKTTSVMSSYSTNSDTASSYPPLITQEKPVTKAAKPKKRGVSICAQIAIFVVVALFIWLVIQNMDPASKGTQRITT